MVWRYLGETTKLPDGRPFSFEGKTSDIWWVFVPAGAPAFGRPDSFAVECGGAAGAEATALGYFVIKWFCAKLRPPEGVAPLAFKGGFWMNFGWAMFYLLSFISIIGWAWVLAAYYRWLCRNVEGGLAFEFRLVKAFRSCGACG